MIGFNEFYIIALNNQRNIILFRSSKDSSCGHKQYTEYCVFTDQTLFLLFMRPLTGKCHSYKSNHGNINIQQRSTYSFSQRINDVKICIIIQNRKQTIKRKMYHRPQVTEEVKTCSSLGVQGFGFTYFQTHATYECQRTFEISHFHFFVHRTLKANHENSPLMPIINHIQRRSNNSRGPTTNLAAIQSKILYSHIHLTSIQNYCMGDSMRSPPHIYASFC